MRLHTMLLLLCALAVADAANGCDKSLINNGVYPKMDYVGNKLKCKRSFQLVKYTTSKAIYLECKGTKWVDDTGTSIGIASTEQLTVDCETTKCHTDLVTPPGFYTSTSKKVQCDLGKRVSIEGAGTYTTVTCDEGKSKWLGDGTQFGKSATDKIIVSCVAPASTTCKFNNAAPVDYDSSSKTLICKRSPSSSAYSLIEVDQKKYVSLTCDDANWKDEKGEDVAVATSDLSVKCVEYCSVMEPAVTYELKENGDVVIKCEETEMDHLGGTKKNAFTLGGKFVASHLYCNAETGFFDFMDHVFEANALVKIKAACEKSPCVKRNEIKCGAEVFTKNEEYFEITKGYDCKDNGLTEYSPFSQTDDPNLLNCNKLEEKYGEKHFILDVKSNIRYFKPLRCSNDTHWYTTDGSKIKVDPQPDNSLHCVKKICNSCVKLSDTTSPQGDLNTYTPGEVDTCAMSTCPNNADLWHVKIGGNVEPYAGKVECSSKKDTEKKWVIDGDTVVEAASCVKKDTPVLCTVASKLKTTCEEAWKKAECKDFKTLNDESTFSCENKTKTMYYNRPGIKGYDEGAKKIKCVKETGVWKLMDEADKDIGTLARNSKLICADYNAQPIATPTTTTPRPNATSTIQSKQSEEDTEAQTAIIVIGSIGGVVVLIIIFIIIFKVCISRKKPAEDKDEETKKKMLEEGKKKKKKQAGDNDEILDEQSVDAPSELKL